MFLLSEYGLTSELNCNTLNIILSRSNNAPSLLHSGIIRSQIYIYNNIKSFN